MTRVDDADRPAAQERYLAANPTAEYYIGFGDFAFYRLDVASIRYVGGYGRMSWVDAAPVRRRRAGPPGRRPPPASSAT